MNKLPKSLVVLMVIIICVFIISTAAFLYFQSSYRDVWFFVYADNADGDIVGNAKIFIDDKYSGSTKNRSESFTTYLKNNQTYKIRIESKGFVPWEKSITPKNLEAIETDGSYALVAILKRK